ncbi:MAG: hypothetical protein HN919_05905 [Verrucomicrobia bacterium]|jgi:alpha-galactosidase/6-phospho-beta-glucosidase family protein|nr:hypothetical protein [Verrucomicrobiota bacterium]MBT7065815.1 hypothetical protein [Verrucomicrobiota bacterium]MBT7700275.1 hypothetical protein [Verrucomicrobiota bacterium]
MLRTFDNGRRKMAFIGASFKFVHKAVRDMVIAPNLSGRSDFENTDVWLYDLDSRPLDLEYDVMCRMIKEHGSGITIHKTASPSRPHCPRPKSFRRCGI